MPGNPTSGRSRGRPPKRLKNDPTLESPLDSPRMAERLEVDVGPLSAQKKSLTSREWVFVQELVAGEGHVTPRDAALRAGYEPKVATRVANALTNPQTNPHVVAAIKQLRKDMAEKYGTTYERHMRDLMLIRDKALEAGNFSAAVVAEYRRGQALGTIYIDRKEIRHGTIDSMSKEDVLKKLEEIKKIYGAGPREIQDIEINEVNNGRARSETVSTSEEESIQLLDHSDRVEGESGNPRFDGGFEFEVSYDRVKGGNREKG